MRRLVVTFDVTALTERQIEQLTLNVTVQAESYDDAPHDEDNYPNVPVVATEVRSPTFADDLRDAMNAWDTIRAAARTQHPKATDAEIDALTRGAFDHALNLK